MDKEDVVHTHTDNGILSNHWKKNEIMPLGVIQMDLEVIILSEVNQIKTNNIWYCLHVQSKWYKWTYIKKKRPTDLETIFKN